LQISLNFNQSEAIIKLREKVVKFLEEIEQRTTTLRVIESIRIQKPSFDIPISHLVKETFNLS
jgi:carbon monoxide dehydrogenase subunit G